MNGIPLDNRVNFPESGMDPFTYKRILDNTKKRINSLWDFAKLPLTQVGNVDRIINPVLESLEELRMIIQRAVNLKSPLRKTFLINIDLLYHRGKSYIEGSEVKDLIIEEKFDLAGDLVSSFLNDITRLDDMILDTTKPSA